MTTVEQKKGFFAQEEHNLLQMFATRNAVIEETLDTINVTMEILIVQMVVMETVMLKQVGVVQEGILEVHSLQLIFVQRFVEMELIEVGTLVMMETCKMGMDVLLIVSKNLDSDVLEEMSKRQIIVQNSVEMA